MILFLFSTENKSEPRFDKESNSDSTSIASNDSSQESVVQQTSKSNYKPAESVEEIMERLSKIKADTQKFEDNSNSLMQSVIAMQIMGKGFNHH